MGFLDFPVGAENRKTEAVHKTTERSACHHKSTSIISKRKIGRVESGSERLVLWSAKARTKCLATVTHSRCKYIKPMRSMGFIYTIAKLDSRAGSSILYICACVHIFLRNCSVVLLGRLREREYKWKNIKLRSPRSAGFLFGFLVSMYNA